MALIFPEPNYQSICEYLDSAVAMGVDDDARVRAAGSLIVLCVDDELNRLILDCPLLQHIVDDLAPDIEVEGGRAMDLWSELVREVENVKALAG